MHMDDTEFGSDRSRSRGTWQRLVDRLAKYVRSRTTDHWIMFLAGVVLGALLA